MFTCLLLKDWKIKRLDCNSSGSSMHTFHTLHLSYYFIFFILLSSFPPYCPVVSACCACCGVRPAGLFACSSSFREFRRQGGNEAHWIDTPKGVILNGHGGGLCGEEWSETLISLFFFLIYFLIYYIGTIS